MLSATLYCFIEDNDTETNDEHKNNDFPLSLQNLYGGGGAYALATFILM